MNFPVDQISELKRIASNLSEAQEGSYTFILIKGLKLPAGCKPEIVDALLCPTPRPDGYNTRLFFSERITGCADRNWNSEIRVLERNWFAISWQTQQPNLRLAEILMIHLNALRHENV